MNPYTYLLNWWRGRVAETKRRQALAGKTTSGHLSVGERQRLFRNRRLR